MKSGHFLRLGLRILLLMAGPGVPVATGAATLHSGDLVLVTPPYFPPPTLWRLDPTTLTKEPISQGGLLQYPSHVMVDLSHRILVVDWSSGVVAIDAATGSQSVLASPAQLGGFSPNGITAAEDGGFYVTASNGTDGAILHLAADGGQVRLVTSGQFLTWPR